MTCDHVTIFFECKVSGIEQMKFQVLQVSFVRMRSICWEDKVVLAPNNQRRRLMLAEVRLPHRLHFYGNLLQRLFVALLGLHADEGLDDLAVFEQ